jgi:Raf kinase inhibitor-like YbhB/YbcL family protein
MPPLFRDLKITSPDFESDGPLPDVHAADRGNQAPRLAVTGVPEGAVELAVICHDPDAPRPRGFSHWTLYGLPPKSTDIDADAVSRFRSGPNGTGSEGYFGPRPPAGHGRHHYYFWVYALNTAVDGAPSREEFLDRYAGDIIEQARIVGTYEN